MNNDFVMNKIGGNMITLGTDPEFFLRKGGKLLPAFRALPEHGLIFADGFQAEINPSPGVMLQPLQARVRKMMAECLAQSGADDISPLSVEEISDEEMETAGQWRQLGCQPSINLYDNYPALPDDGGTVKQRFAGNHIHFGRMCSKKEITRIVKGLDAVLAVWSVGCGEGIESPIRRQYYGLAGEFREQRWGLEYRTLSNLPLLHPALWNSTFRLARDVFNLSLYDKLDFWNAKENDWLNAINLTDVEKSRAILYDNRDVFTRLAGPLAYQLGMHGFIHWAKPDIRGNWGI
jgi:hypothetical protein